MMAQLRQTKRIMMMTRRRQEQQEQQQEDKQEDEYDDNVVLSICKRAKNPSRVTREGIRLDVARAACVQHAVPFGRFFRPTAAAVAS